VAYIPSELPLGTELKGTLKTESNGEGERGVMTSGEGAGLGIFKPEHGDKIPGKNSCYKYIYYEII